MKVNVYLPDEIFRDAKQRGLNLSRTLRDAISRPERSGPPPKTPNNLIRHARLVVAEADLRGVRGPIYTLLVDLADALEGNLRSIHEPSPSCGCATCSLVRQTLRTFA